MSEGPRIRHNRFEGYPLEVKYDWMQQGAGSGAVHPPADALRAVHEAAEQCRDRVARALADLGLDWYGAAASALFDAARPSLEWAMGAMTAAQTNLAGVAAHGVDFAETKPKIESAQPVRQPGLADGAAAAFNPLALLQIQQDMHEQLAANKARDDAANRALYAFETAARAQAESAPALPDPPRIAVEAVHTGPPPTPPGGRDRDRGRREPPVVGPPARGTEDPARTQPPTAADPGPVDPGTSAVPGNPADPADPTRPADATRPQAAAPPALRPEPPIPGVAAVGGGAGFGGSSVGFGATAGLPGALGGPTHRGSTPRTPGPATTPTPRVTPSAPGKPGAPGASLLQPPLTPGTRREDDVEHNTRYRTLSDEIYGLDDLPTVPPPVIGEGPEPS
ncbi:MULTISPECIES: hypothetical protein [unclassified Crossiella]|uniref:hypothetical protein n=1 Tax=unclassified Crossiella TaxID=2620835 RepID=UPI001FFEB6DD|nr:MULTISPECIES: hypothetical protein [unclassified Crossiella]MCK2239552.1 hypothetical protein [Crossiella sp. S99.2]MCK2252247.1 hypothetical protein [Crossiella sp. S99.1]